MVGSDDPEGPFAGLCLAINKQQDHLSFLAFCFVGMGLLFLGVAYLYPRTYLFDPMMPAREMEAIEIYYAKLNDGLDIVTLIGLALVTMGGVTMSSLVAATMWAEQKAHEECQEGTHLELRGEAGGYGSTSQQTTSH